MKGKVDIFNSCLSAPSNVQINKINSISEEVDGKSSASPRENHVRKSIHVSDLLNGGSSKRLSSADFETAISHAGFGKFNYFLLLVAFPANISAIMNSGSIALALPAITCDFRTTDFEKGLLQSACYIGMISSAFFWGSVSDSFGRKKLLMYGFFLDSLMGIGASLSPSLWLMIIFKVLNGAMNSGPLSIFMAYISEIFVQERRDLAVLSCGIISALGNLLHPSLALLFLSYFPLETPLTVYGDYEITSWRIFLLVCSIPSLLSAIACSFLVESPKFLLDKGRRNEAMGVFRTIYSVNSGMPASSYPVITLQEMRSPSIIASSKLASNQTFFGRVKSGMTQSLTLFRRPYIGRVAYYFAIQAGTMAGYNSFRLWLPQMFSIALSGSTSNTTVPEGGLCDLLVAASGSPAPANCASLSSVTYTNMLLINCGLLVSHPLFILCVKLFGKKVPIVISSLVPSFFVFTIPFIPASYVVYVAAIFMSLLNVAFFALLNSVVNTFPTRIKALSVSMTQMFGRIGLLSTNFIVAVLVFNHCTAVIVAIGFMLFVVGVVALLLPTSPIEDENPVISSRQK